ncbi:peptidase [Sphingomonas sp. Leaf17]|uniref:PepSY-associated TM helix domain-containing protein n=1 Tax=Sphingomonas sp. Leaf17 TaxID=1735683 RepID=UPI000700A857|nr:PepSY-associated TM helix domain-containing protein [Sphingomonas sp. Leaf17]KQM68158.1 peptidase [Sphingomonas sp. Leaf17]
MTSSSIRTWYLVHKWTSLICTIFLLMLCVTGLPLIFSDEIDRLGGGQGRFGMPGVGSSGNAPGLLSLDTMMTRALAARPGEVPLFMAFDNDQPSMTITTGPTPDAPAAQMTTMTFDRSTGGFLSQEDGGGVMHVLLDLHTDLFLGLPGMLFLGAMGALFVAALVSGVVLYAPFMRKLAFGTLRTSRSARLKWLDYHNLLGVVALAWMTVVGVTGVINTLEKPINALWQRGELTAMTRAYAGKAALPPAGYGSLDTAMAAARKALPGNNPQFIGFPGGSFSSRHHYAVFFQGDTPLTQHLLTPALIDAETGTFTTARSMPWYNKALSLSRPLHFGDYGGLPLKILWAVLDIFTIVVLATGLYLWLGKRRASAAAHVREVETGGLAVPAE